MKTIVSLAILMLTLPLSGASSPAASTGGYAPAAVLAYDDGREAYVTWTPVVVLDAEVAYRVYGIDARGRAVLLDTMPGWHVSAHVEGGFHRFGVSVVVDGREGEIVTTCVTIRPTFPFVRIGPCD